MAINNKNNYSDKDGIGFPLNFRRGNPNPLDNSSVWLDLESAKIYAKENPVAYVGQIISVVENNTVNIYKIVNESGKLELVGTQSDWEAKEGSIAEIQNKPNIKRGEGSNSINQFGTIASGKNAISVGEDTTASGVNSSAEGKNTVASGMNAHAEGYASEATGYGAHAENGQTRAAGGYSHAEGYLSTAEGDNSHSEGTKAKALGNNSHAEGQETQSVGDCSHAEGLLTIASGANSHAAGLQSKALSNATFATGLLTKAGGKAFKVIQRSEITTEMGTASEYTLSSLTGIQSALAEAVSNGQQLYYAAHMADTDYYELGVVGQINPSSNTVIGGGYSNIHQMTDLEKTLIPSVDSYLLIAGYPQLGDTEIGSYAFAEGVGSHAQHYASHVEGINTFAVGPGSHAEGIIAQAVHLGSHAEGFHTIAGGAYSHAGGTESETAGDNAFAHGEKVYAYGKNQFVTGQYNKQDLDALFIVGNGINDERSNAFEIDHDGNAYVQQKLYTGGTADNRNDAKEVLTSDDKTAIYNTILEDDPTEESLEISLELSDGLITPSGMPTSNPKEEGSTARDVHSQRIDVQTGDVLVLLCDNTEHTGVTHYFEYVTAYDYYGHLVHKGSTQCESYTVPGGVSSVIVSIETDNYCLLRVGITRREVNVKGVKRLEAEKLDRTEATKELTKYSNALIASKSGETIAITDTSPIEHEMDVKVTSKNLIPFPYTDSTAERGGISFTVNDDRSIAISGNTSAFLQFVVADGSSGINLDHGATYTLSGGIFTYTDPNGEEATESTILRYKNANGEIQSVRSGESFVWDNNNELVEIAFGINSEGCSYDTIASAPQLERGTTATAYTPYIEDFSTVKVKKYGKNLLNSSVRLTPKTDNGLTVQYLPDEDCYLLNGTTTKTSNYYHVSEDVLIDGKVTASVKVLSGSIDNPNNGYTRFYLGGRDDLNAAVSNWSDALIEQSGSRTSSTVKKYLSATWFYIDGGITFNNYKVQLQIERGASATEYEPYIEPIEYPVSADGTVEGVTSIYPTTTLCIESAETTARVEVEYKRDINKALDTAGIAPVVSAINYGTYILEPNVVYEFTNLTGNLQIQFASTTASIDNEWAFILSQGDTAKSVTLPNIEWYLGIAPVFKPNSTTEVRVHVVNGKYKGVWM